MSSFWLFEMVVTAMQLQQYRYGSYSFPISLLQIWLKTSEFNKEKQENNGVVYADFCELVWPGLKSNKKK